MRAHTPIIWAIAFAIVIYVSVTASRIANTCEKSSIELLNNLKVSLDGCDTGKVEKQKKFDSQKPETGKPETGKPETGKPETGKPETGKPETGKPETGKPETGKLETGKLETGKLETGKLETGKLETGKLETGKLETRKSETQSGKFVKFQRVKAIVSMVRPNINAGELGVYLDTRGMNDCIVKWDKVINEEQSTLSIYTNFSELERRYLSQVDCDYIDGISK